MKENNIIILDGLSLWREVWSLRLVIILCTISSSIGGVFYAAKSHVTFESVIELQVAELPKISKALIEDHFSMQFFSSEELDSWKLRHAVAKPNFDVSILKNNMSASTDGGVLIGEVFFQRRSEIVVQTKTSDSGYDMGPLIDYTHQYAEFIAERFKQRLLKVMEDGVFGFENQQSYPHSFYAEPMTEEILARGLLKGDFPLV